VWKLILRKSGIHPFLIRLLAMTVLTGLLHPSNIMEGQDTEFIIKEYSGIKGFINLGPLVEMLVTVHNPLSIEMFRVQ